MTMVSPSWIYGTTYGRPPRTSSRVPSTRPGRPMPGCCASVSTRRMISSTASIAASGLSRLMYRSTDSRSWLAARVHFSPTLALPSPHHRLVFRKLAGLRLLEAALDGTNEPFLVVEITLNGLVDNPCSRAAHRAGNPVDTLQRVRVHTDRGGLFGSHNQREYN